MSSRERRISPRKDCAVPLRFRVLSNAAPPAQAESGGKTVVAAVSREILEGEALNLSERGIYFRSREALAVGLPLEIYLQLPAELTGRLAEEVRCSARVVHVEQAENGGLAGFGAVVERFEPVARIRSWHN